MDARIFVKTRSPHRHVTEGTSRAPHHAYVRAMQLTSEHIHLPLIDAVISCRNAAAFRVRMRKTPAAKLCLALKRGAASAGAPPHLAVTGCTVNENLRKVVSNPDQDRIWRAGEPTATSGAAGFQGSLAPEGALAKVAGMPEAKLTLGGPALCCTSECDREEGRCMAVNRCHLNRCHFMQEGGPCASDTRKFAKRKKDWKPRKTIFGSDALSKSVRVPPAATVGVLCRGSFCETNVYVDV
ncbi:MAG TPA: dihydroxy-acid dehydratase [Methylocella sp.]|nr:dihydroxy-acid dehydratase [Methylocella sp.]